MVTKKNKWKWKWEIVFTDFEDALQFSRCRIARSGVMSNKYQIKTIIFWGRKNIKLKQIFSGMRKSIKLKKIIFWGGKKYEYAQIVRFQPIKITFSFIAQCSAGEISINNIFAEMPPLRLLIALLYWWSENWSTTHCYELFSII